MRNGNDLQDNLAAIVDLLTWCPCVLPLQRSSFQNRGRHIQYSTPLEAEYYPTTWASPNSELMSQCVGWVPNADCSGEMTLQCGKKENVGDMGNLHLGRGVRTWAELPYNSNFSPAVQRGILSNPSLTRRKLWITPSAPGMMLQKQRGSEGCNKGHIFPNVTRHKNINILDWEEEAKCVSVANTSPSPLCLQPRWN